MFRRSFSGAGQVYILIGAKVMTKMKKTQKTQNNQKQDMDFIFFTKLHKNKNGNNCIVRHNF